MRQCLDHAGGIIEVGRQYETGYARLGRCELLALGVLEFYRPLIEVNSWLGLDTTRKVTSQ